MRMRVERKGRKREEEKGKEQREKREKEKRREKRRKEEDERDERRGVSRRLQMRVCIWMIFDTALSKLAVALGFCGRIAEYVRSGWGGLGGQWASGCWQGQVPIGIQTRRSAECSIRCEADKGSA